MIYYIIDAIIRIVGIITISTLLVLILSKSNTSIGRWLRIPNKIKSQQ